METPKTRFSGFQRFLKINLELNLKLTFKMLEISIRNARTYEKQNVVVTPRGFGFRCWLTTPSIGLWVSVDVGIPQGRSLGPRGPGRPLRP
jgi:hypothetical protein